MRSGKAIVKNKPKRVQAITADIKQLLAAGSMLKGQAATLKGKVQYAESYTYGRLAVSSIRVLGEIASGQRSGNPLSVGDQQVLQWFSDRLISAKPRQLLADSNRRPLVIFTDAASEGSTHTCGGMIYNLEDGKKEYFSETIEPMLIQEWQKNDVKQIIGPAELYPVWMAREIWADKLKGRRVLFFVDNNGSKDSLVRGFTFSECGYDIVKAVLNQEFLQESWNWYARVQTHSNPADDPSRLDVGALDKVGWVRVRCPQPNSFKGGLAKWGACTAAHQ
jgi:hypothetical protein